MDWLKIMLMTRHHRTWHERAFWYAIAGKKICGFCHARCARTHRIHRKHLAQLGKQMERQLEKPEIQLEIRMGQLEQQEQLEKKMGKLMVGVQF